MKTIKVKDLLIALVTILILIPPAMSQGVGIYGGSDCGQWVANSKSNFSLKAWVLGYISGLNAALGDSRNDPLYKINSAEQIFLWMDNFCQKNPLKTVQEGGNALYSELRTKSN
jgi:hypothetical protein